MKKRICLITLCTIMVAALFAGCGAKEAKATISNDSDWTFNEIYLSPTASDDWGADQLGGTNILKSGGSYEITLEKTDNGLYDIEAVDDEGTYWTFMRVPLEAGSEVVISHTGTDAIALSISPKGEETEVVGALEGTQEYVPEEQADAEEQTVPDEDVSEEQAEDWIELELTNYSDYIFDQIYIAASDQSDPGYNHIESIGWLDPGASCMIGVELLPSYDVALVDEDNDVWGFEYVTFEDAYAVDVSWPDEDPLLVVYYSSDGGSAEFWGQIISDAGDQLVG